jgi:hypothetical protein
MFCLKVFSGEEYLRAHYKKRHTEAYLKEGLEDQENVQLMANLLSAADQATLKSSSMSRGPQDTLAQDDFV